MRMPLEGAPDLFRRRCIGLGGKSFDRLNFRIMFPSVEHLLQDLLLEQDHEGKATWLHSPKLKINRRITQIRRSVRRTSLDELACLWNVLRGEREPCQNPSRREARDAGPRKVSVSWLGNLA